MRNFLTVDVEEWFHVCGVDGPLARHHWPDLPSRVELTTDLVLSLLDECRAQATFFVLGWVAERHPGLVRRIVRAGHEVGSHGWSHARIYELTPDAFETELARATGAIEAGGAPRPLGFRAPEWSINDRSLWALESLVRRGFRFDSSMAPLRLLGNPAYPQAPGWRDTPAGALFEVPPMVRRRLGFSLPFGGGWGLRICRPEIVVEEIARRNARGDVATLFLHPWEIDPDPPRVRLPAGLAFSHYYRLDGYRERLKRILTGAPFGPIEVPG